MLSISRKRINASCLACIRMSLIQDIQYLATDFHKVAITNVILSTNFPGIKWPSGKILMTSVERCFKGSSN